MRASLYWHCTKRLIRYPPSPWVFVNLAAYFLNKHLFRSTTLGFYPLSVVIYLTKRCNYSCSYCYAKDALNPKNFANDLTLPQLRDLLGTPYGRRALRVGLLGGEPFLNKDIFQMIRELKRHGKIITVVSNASLVTDAKIAPLLESGLDVLGLSLYDNNRRHVERVVRAINGKMRYWVQSVVTSRTIAEMESIIEYCLSIGCESLHFSNCVPIDGMDENLAIFDDDETYRETERRLRAKYGGRLDIDWVNPLRRTKTKRACAMPFSYVHVDNVGNLGACCMRPPDGEKFGNVYKDRDAWNLPFYRKLRASMYDMDQEPLDVCRLCDNLNQDLYRI